MKNETQGTRYMLATKAYHKLGDISRDTPDLCIIESEHENHYEGRWAEGLGFVGVRFPKKTTRPLTPKQAKRFKVSP